MRSTGAATALALLVALVLPGPIAEASFHLMKIEEVDTGHNGDATQQYVNLQMYTSGQHLVGGHALRVYAADGSAQDCVLPSDVPSGADQSHILIAAASPIHGVIPDFVLPPILQRSGGAVCFAGVDCVSWGTFAGSTPSDEGTPHPSDVGADDASLHRIDRAPLGTLDPNDDTNDSAADFITAPPEPQNNAGGAAAAAPTTCQPVTTAPPPDPDPSPSLAALKASVKGGKATVRGRVLPPAPGQRAALAFFANGSPLRKIAKAKVTLNEQSRFRKRFGVPSDSTRCKVVVRFAGSKLGAKRFRC